MKTILKTAAACAALTMASLSVAQPAFAQNAEKNMRYIEVITVDPSKGMEWNKGWMGLNELVEGGDYPYTEVVLTHRNKRWILTPIENYAEIDAVISTRIKFAEKHGEKFDKAYGKMLGAEMDSHSFIARFDPELSYLPEGDSPESYSKVETYHYRASGGDEMKSILTDFKAIAEDVGSPNGYGVYWNGLGTNGHSVTIVSTGENELDLAQEDAADDKLMEGRKEDMDKLFARFVQVAQNSTTEFATLKPEMSMNLPEQ
jgi:hypothetical protein